MRNEGIGGVDTPFEGDKSGRGKSHSEYSDRKFRLLENRFPFFMTFLATC